MRRVQVMPTAKPRVKEATSENMVDPLFLKVDLR
jgi:hypothetical protein